MSLKESLSAFWKKIRNWLPGLIISLVAIYVIVRLAKWQDLSKAFTRMQLGTILLGFVLVMLFLVFRGLAWKTLLGQKVSFTKAFLVINIGYLLNNLFPLRAGELGRAVLMGSITRAGPLYVLSTIIIERAFDMALAAGFLLSTLPLALGMEWARPVALVTLTLVILGLFVLFLMAQYRIKVEGWVNQIGRRWSFVQKTIVPWVSSLLKGLGVLTNPGQFLLSLLWLVAAWCTTIVYEYVFILPIAPQAPLWWGAFCVGVLSMGIAMPSAPAQIGIYEGALVAALTILGVDPSAALASAILIHFIGVVTTCVLGLYGLAREGHSITDLFTEIQKRGKSSISSN